VNRGFIERDGSRIGYLDWGGDGEPLLLLHPNGLCAGFFDPLARRLTDRFHPIAVDLRAHGPSDPPPTPDGYAYVEQAADVLAVLDHLGLTGAVGLGESLGGGVLTIVDRTRPGFLRRIALCEAIAFPPFHLIAGQENPAAVLARKRRRSFPSRQAMIESYATKPVFAPLAPEALAAYVEHGTFIEPGGSVRLACDPDDEADIFIACSSPIGAQTAWDHLPDLSCEAVVAAGTKSNLMQDWFRNQAERIGAKFVPIDGGHFFIHEDTDRAERLVREWLA
jgi:pimeloyl-ACP methyl ester carboxylesterase